MKKVAIVSLMVGLLFCACGKKEAPPAPAAEGPKAAPIAPQPAAEAQPFVIPPSAKKQAKYFPEGTPSRAIQDLDDMLDSYVLDPQTAEDRQYNANLKRAVIHGTFDIGELCRLALDKHWGERTPEEQATFVDLMTRLLEKKAIFSKEQGQKKKKTKSLYKVTYDGDKSLNPEKTNSLAMSTVHIPSEALKIGLNYKLKKVEKGWMIYDVIVDGASLLDNYKYQFDKIIDKEGYPNLVHRMESKLKELEEKNKENPVEP